MTAWRLLGAVILAAALAAVALGAWVIAAGVRCEGSVPSRAIDCWPELGPDNANKISNWRPIRNQ